MALVHNQLCVVKYSAHCVHEGVTEVKLYDVWVKLHRCLELLEEPCHRGLPLPLKKRHGVHLTVAVIAPSVYGGEGHYLYFLYCLCVQKYTRRDTPIVILPHPFWERPPQILTRGKYIYPLKRFTVRSRRQNFSTSLPFGRIVKSLSTITFP